MILLRLLLVVLFFSCSSLQANVNTYFNQINKDPNALFTFLKSMPKGGELHYHLWGGAYSESILDYAAKSDYCFNKDTFVITKNPQHCDGIKTKEILNQPNLYVATIKDWSLKDFVPGNETAFEHFFNGFSKYLPVIIDYSPQLLTHVIQRAAEQHEQYLEIMILPDNANSLQFATTIESDKTYAQKKDTLLANKAFMANIRFAAKEPARILNQTRQQLGCKDKPETPACAVTVKFQVYLLREQPLDSIFAQALTAFETVMQSKGALVGVNLVQPENGILSIRDYRKQMEIFNYFHTQYPQVNISLHAGELEPESVIPEELGYHIHDAIFTAHAQRIGHGVDIAYENNAETTLKYMADHQLAVEINLTSNQKILNISGSKHPLNYYLAHKVPVVLSTDDEGILRTDLTHQYVQATMEQGLDYPTLKQINRNALTYAFLPGKSIWANPMKGELVQECLDLNSITCHEFTKHNQKARIQWDLEQKLIQFERQF